MPQGEGSKKAEKKLRYQRPALIPLGRITTGLGTACADGSVPGRSMDAESIAEGGNYCSTLQARVRGVTSKHA